MSKLRFLVLGTENKVYVHHFSNFNKKLDFIDILNYKEDEEKDDSFYTFFDRPIYDKVQEVRRNRDLETDFYYLTSEFGIPQLYEETKDEYCAALIVYFHDEGDERGESIKEFALSHLINQGLVLEKTEVFFNEKDKDNDDEINRYLWSHLGVEFLEDLWD